MEAKLVINGVDFAPRGKSGGIQQQYAIRRSREVVATDGTIYRREIKKRHLSVSLVELRDSTLRRLAGAPASRRRVLSRSSTRETDRCRFLISRR